MGAIGLNPIRLDRIGLDPIRINAIKLGVPGASSGSDRPYIDPEVLASLKAVCICYGKSNDDPDRAVVKNLVDPDNPFVISNAAYTEGSGYADKGSPYYGAFVTDGIDDLITSTKTVQEMLGGSNEITVVSMIHQIADRGSTFPNIYNNQIRYSTRLLRSTVTAANVVGKTGIYGYTATGVSITGTPTGKVVNDILGDKNDYPYLASAFTGIDAESHFSVEGYLSDTGIIVETSQVAWYWTIIANKVLTTDQINQVIAYFNLDKYVKPDICYDVKKQGLTNNTPDADWYLKDFSGNGRDMQLYNYSKTPESGINEEGGLQSDGATDYGQYVGDLGLKDYTVAVDRAYVETKPSQVPIISNVVDGSVNTPFLMEHLGLNKILAPHSFGTYTRLAELNINRFISYQSTYKYNGSDIIKGTSTNTGSGLTIGRIGGVASQYGKICLWSLMLFPYSMSEFLIERQLKKHKLGTLYPDMVEWRPIVKSNLPYSSITYSVNPGEYISVDSMVTITVTLPNTSDKLMEVSCNAISDISISGDNGVYEITGKVGKSPQKINMIISSYLTMLNNSTLISNETLIKNE